MRGPVKVLIADDEKELVDSLAKALRRRNMEVSIAYGGAAALAALADDEFDVIVLDVRMPGLDGIATLESIRQRDPLTPVLLLSGHADVERATAGLAKGASDFLMKPCPVETLCVAIEDASEKKALARALDRS
jgi:DNA-binding NtrC family response regulator